MPSARAGYSEMSKVVPGLGTQSGEVNAIETGN